MPSHWKEVKAPEGSTPVKKVVLWFNYHQGHSHLNGIQFYAADGSKIVEGGNCYQNKKEIELGDQERIIGAKSFNYDSTNP